MCVSWLFRVCVWVCGCVLPFAYAWLCVCMHIKAKVKQETNFLARPTANNKQTAAVRFGYLFLLSLFLFFIYLRALLMGLTAGVCFVRVREQIWWHFMPLQISSKTADQASPCPCLCPSRAIKIMRACVPPPWPTPIGISCSSESLAPFSSSFAAHSVRRNLVSCHLQGLQLQKNLITFSGNLIWRSRRSQG